MDWADLKTLLYKEWTRRVWTYQEILLASRPILVCGLSHLAWDEFTWSLVFLINFGNDNRRRVLTTWVNILYDRTRLLSPDNSQDIATVTVEEYIDFIKRMLRARKRLDWS